MLGVRDARRLERQGGANTNPNIVEGVTQGRPQNVKSENESQHCAGGDMGPYENRRYTFDDRRDTNLT